MNTFCTASRASFIHGSSAIFLRLFFLFGGISFSVASAFAWTKWPYCSVMVSSSVQSSAYRLRTVTVYGCCSLEFRNDVQSYCFFFAGVLVMRRLSSHTRSSMNFGESVSRGFNPGAVLACIHFRVSVAHVIQVRGAAPHVVAVVHSLNSVILTVDPLWFVRSASRTCHR